MKIIYTLLILTGCCFHDLTAQIVFEAKGIDLIHIEDDGALSFYQKKGNRYREISIDFDNLSPRMQQPDIEKGEWEGFKNLFNTTDRFISVKDIRPYSAKALMRHLALYQFRTVEIDDNGDTSYSYQQLFNPYLLLITDKDIWDDGSGQYIEDLDYYTSSFCILKLGYKKHIIIHYLDDGYYIPAKNKEYIFVKGFDFHELPIAKEKVNEDWKNDKTIQDVVETSDFVGNHYYEEYTDDDQMILTGEFDKALLKDKYDKIEQRPYFITATKGNRTEIYNLFLERIADNVRSYTYSGYSSRVMHILKKDTVLAIDYKGNINPEQLYIDDMRPEIPPSYPCYNGSFSSGRYYTEVKAERIDSTYYIVSKFRDSDPVYNYDQKNEIRLPEHITAKDVSFLPDIGEKSKEQERWFYIKKDGLCGLFAVQNPDRQIDPGIVAENHQQGGRSRDTVYTGMPVTPRQLVPVSMDSITPLYKYNRDQQLIYKDGQVGVYPIHHTPKYRSVHLQPSGGFIRFVMPDGRKGWLNLHTGQECYD